MNKLITILMLVSPMFLFASSDCKTTKSAESKEEQLEIKTDVPAWLKGATITIKQADGKESVVSADKFKVVPRKQQFIVTKTKQLEQTTCQEEAGKNRVSLLGGVGPSNSLKVVKTPSQATISTESGLVGGIMYQRSIGKGVSVGGQVQTNSSGLLSVGLDF